MVAQWKSCNWYKHVCLFAWRTAPWFMQTWASIFITDFWDWCKHPCHIPSLAVGSFLTIQSPGDSLSSCLVLQHEAGGKACRLSPFLARMEQKVAICPHENGCRAKFSLKLKSLGRELHPLASFVNFWLYKSIISLLHQNLDKHH